MAVKIITNREDQRWKRVITHLVLWVILYLFLYYSHNLIPDYSIVNILLSSSLTVQIIIVFYVFGYIIFPKYLYKLNLLIFLTYIIAAIQLIYLNNYFLFKILYPYSSGYQREYTSYVETVWVKNLKPAGFFGCFNSIRAAGWNFVYSIMLMLLLLAGKAIRDTFDFRQKSARLEFEKMKLERDNILLNQTNLQLELDFLKTQINPHFLFNTLNSIYVEIIDTNEQAATRLAMLATLMRYGLYEANTERISLVRELDYIRTYLELEKIRHQDQATIRLTQQGDFQAYQIAPLLLISFVENAFKHGVNKSKEGAFLSVSATMQEGTFRFCVENSVASRTPKASVGGIGLTNSRKRLDLLYPGQYTLIIEEAEDLFHVLLTLHLPT